MPPHPNQLINEMIRELEAARNSGDFEKADAAAINWLRRMTEQLSEEQASNYAITLEIVELILDVHRYGDEAQTANHLTH